MTDHNMPTDKTGGEKYLRANKTRLMKTIAWINNNYPVTTDEIHDHLWAEIAEIDEQLGESTGE